MDEKTIESFFSFQETGTVKRKLQMMKQKKMSLIAEVRYNLHIITFYFC